LPNKRKCSRWARVIGRHDTTLTGFLYSLELPLGIVAGFKFADNDYLLGSFLIGLTMFIEMVCAKNWIGTQTRQIAKALANET